MSPPAPAAVTSERAGPVLFARFAYPPNALGYCGPGDSLSLLEYAAAGISDEGLRSLARRFEGAWPYLELIARASGLADALHPSVVEAYWIGNALLDRVSHRVFASFLEEAFGRRAGRAASDLAQAAIAGGVPHHNFHVFSVYPWVGMLRAGRVAEPLGVLEKCRIRWGEVVDVVGDRAMIRSRPIRWQDGRLGLGDPRIEVVSASSGGRRLSVDARPGDAVAVHWDWICHRLTTTQALALRRCTHRTLALVNGLDRPPVAALD